jgi:hypothetical protein
MRRPVERASLRQTVTDRIVAAVLVVVAASGLMSILPAASQQSVARVACRAGSLGLGSCGSATVIRQSEQLSPPRCPILAALDETVPEVRLQQITSAAGLRLQISTARSGDSTLSLGANDSTPPPRLLEGEPRTPREILPGVQIPGASEWFLPSGQGAEAIVDAVLDRHGQWAQRRSSLAVLSGALDRGGRDVPPPTVLISQVRLDAPVLPHVGGPPTRTSGLPTANKDTASGRSYVSLVPNRPALLAFNRVSRESAVIAEVEGVVGKTDVTGSVRWTRDAGGMITSVLLGIVSDTPLAAGERSEMGTTGIAYVSVPVDSAAERDLVQAWLSDAHGFRVGLDELLGRETPKPEDQLTSFLTRAATVTILRFSGTDSGQAAEQVRDELTTLRRVEREGTRLVGASQIEPQPNREARVLATDPSCPTP